ncbi:pickpocket protein 28-like [Wyeomyia smithii]|uniref:pickpocket protein 28-like n=1 Tax=Wyeomyia smithii TaxID=174621 RepID=UPI002467EEE9|nr:pickpocket protein 28-like [Wyeomyia smithii]
MYAARAKKFQLKEPPSVRPARNYLQESRQLAEEFCENTSIHGVKYFVGSQRALIEKVWWIAVFLLSLYGCGRLIYTVYRKWDNEPVIVTFAQKSTPVFQVPFPAVTVCPETKAKVSEFNFTEVFHLNFNPQARRTLSNYQLRQLQAMLQICEFSFNDQMFNQTYDDDCVTLLKNMSIPQMEMFVICGWHTTYFYCSDEFKLILTDVGYCYSFNLLSSDDILRKDQLHTEFEYLLENRSSSNWSLDEGYQVGTDINTYPRRALGAGLKAGLMLLLKSNESDMDYLCGNSFQGFKLLLHMPNEYPQVLNQHFRVPLNQEVTVAVTPRMIETSRNIASYKPIRRQCYFNNERYLKFFRIYTQSNCELECLANFTLRRCGCVKFSMPRAAHVRICGVLMETCYEKATVELLELEVKIREDRRMRHVDECSCLPSCTAVQYNTEISQASFEWQKLLPMVPKIQESIQGTQVSHLQVFLKDSQFIPIQRNELFGLTDFLANCGGLLGLFMGVSILSFVEIVYYCVIKPAILWGKAKPEQKPLKPIKTVSRSIEFDAKKVNIRKIDGSLDYVSVATCVISIVVTYQQWIYSPVIIGYDSKLQPTWAAPFPAVTICPMDKVKSAYFNLTEAFLQLKRGEMLNISEYKFYEIIRVLKQVCPLAAQMLGPLGGFMIYIHPPDEVPTLTTPYYRLPHGSVLSLSIKPELTLISKALKKHHYQRRQCYFNGERMLRYFQIYNQNNCILECIANRTLMLCDCIAFSAPRGPNVTVCDASKQSCYDSAIDDIFNPDVVGAPTNTQAWHEPCGCLPACTALKYEAEITREPIEFDQYITATGNSHYDYNRVDVAILYVSYKSKWMLSLMRQERIGFTDLLAKFGGLFGLMMGASLISFLELVYYCLIRPCRNEVSAGSRDVHQVLPWRP